MLHIRPTPPLLLVACDSPTIQRVKPKLRLSSSALQAVDQSADSAFQPQANEIAPRVFVSDLSTAQCRKAMAALGITHVVSVMPGNIELPHDVFTSTLQVSIADMPFADLLSHLEDTSFFIQQALDSNPSSRVLVHCAKGRSRSCSVAAAHLMAARGWTVEQAVAHVQQHRRIAQPNAGFIGQLHEYYDVLHGPLSASTSSSSGSDDYSDDASMPSPSDSD